MREVLAKACQENRRRLVEALPSEKRILYFKGGVVKYRSNSDTELPFRQDSVFLWLFGVEKPNFSAQIDTATGHATLFRPVMTPHDAVWTVGDQQMSNQTLAEYYAVDAVGYSENMPTDATQTLLETIQQLRLIKNPFEIQLITEACRRAARAHRKVMKATVAKLGKIKESDQARLFQFYCRNPFQAYLPICASGRNAAVLHYQDNAKVVAGGELSLLDMGTELHGYASDITITFPSNGKFTPEQAAIYECTLEANLAVQLKMKSGVSWGYLQDIAAEVIYQGLKKLGIMKDSAPKSIIKTFMPHGLGHHLGLDVHDGRLHPETILKTQMVVTVEPGIYFIRSLLDQVKVHLNLDILERYFGVGGVRIEDDILVTDDSSINLTKNLPRKVKNIEHYLLGL